MGTRSEDVITEGDKVVTRLTASGTHKRDLPGIPARGEHVTIACVGASGRALTKDCLEQD